jgi:hypothetical protein
LDGCLGSQDAEKQEGFLDEKIARALAQDAKKKGGGTIYFHDDEAIYTVTVSVERTSVKYLRENKGTFISAGSPGTACGCCSGTGRQ